MGPIAYLGPVSGLDPCLALNLARAIAAGDGNAIEGFFLDLAKRLEAAEDRIDTAEWEAKDAIARAEAAEGEKEDAEEKLDRAETRIANLEADCDAALDFAEAIAARGEHETEAAELVRRLKEED